MDYTYNMLLDDVNNITTTIQLSQWKPDVIIGIARGGLIPAVMLSHRLNVPIKTVDWSYRDWNKRQIPFDVNTDNFYAKKQMLFVDDIVDGGETMCNLVKQFRLPVKTASLIYNNNQQLHIPDFYGRIIDRSVDKDWVNFWWERG